MNDPINARMLLKKVLERWENEGGKVLVEPSKSLEDAGSREIAGESRQRVEPHPTKPPPAVH